MARAAAKRRQPVAAPEPRRRQRGKTPKSFEDQLFFNRLRNHAKWVFVFLAVVFAGTFVFLGVGSGGGSGLSDFFSSIYHTGSGGGSIGKALKETEKTPKSPKAWRDLAEAYELKGENDDAVKAWTRVTQLQPRSIDALSRLASLYEAESATQTQEAQLAQTQAQAVGGSPFQLPTSSPLAQALGTQDPIAQAASSAANNRFGDALTARQKTLTKLTDVYGKIAKLEPDDASAQLQLASAAQNAGQSSVALTAYKRFLKLAPDDPNASYAKQQIKSLQSQLSGTPQK